MSVREATVHVIIFTPSNCRVMRETIRMKRATLRLAYYHLAWKPGYSFKNMPQNYRRDNPQALASGLSTEPTDDTSCSLTDHAYYSATRSFMLSSSNLRSVVNFCLASFCLRTGQNDTRVTSCIAQKDITSQSD